MSYAQSANRANPVAMLGALGVPAAFGAVLVAGLAVKYVIVEPPKNPTGFTVTPTPIEPPPPIEPKPETNQVSQQQTATQQPPTRPDSQMDLTTFAPITTLPNPGPVTYEPIDLGVKPGGNIVPDIPTLPDPVKASPRNNPGAWVTDSDYRSSWINREWDGVAQFSVTIDTRGRVSNCTITGSTGHSALDEATCRLVERRARFDPAKDSNGDAITGTYSASVNWQIPE